MEIEIVNPATGNCHKAWLCDRCNIRVTKDLNQDRWVRKQKGLSTELLELCPHCADADRPRVQTVFREFDPSDMIRQIQDMRRYMRSLGLAENRLIWKIGRLTMPRINSDVCRAITTMYSPVETIHGISIMGIDAIEDLNMPENGISLELRP